MKSVLVIRCMALIVPLGAFINQLHPNPQLYYYKKKPQQCNDKTELKRERERERERRRERKRERERRGGG